MNISEQIKEYAKSLGFHLVKIMPAVSLDKERDYFNEWLGQGFEGDLGYMEKDPEKRSDPKKILPGAKSVICFAMNYYQESPSDFPENSGKVARYAWGKDYHSVIEKKLKKLRQFIIEHAEQNPNKTDFKLYSDAGPFLERGFAAKAGLGFIGKNTTLITQEFGSWVFLSEIITTLELPYDKPSAQHGSCGTCTKCVDACPTKALIKPYVLDARKCISYLTIESKKAIPSELKEKIKDRIFGCDICQEVCPHNCRAKQTDVKEFTEHRAGPFLNLNEIKNMSEKEFDEKYKGSPIRRAGLKGVMRNI